MSFSFIRHNGTAISGQSIHKAATSSNTSSLDDSYTPNIAFVPIPTSSNSRFDWPVVFREEIFWTYLSTVCLIGVCLNTIVVRSVLRRSKLSGSNFLILQLCLCDIISLLVAPVDLHYVQHQRWSFPVMACSIYLGLESICSTTTVYLLICLNLHAISTFNLAQNMLGRNNKDHHEYTAVPQQPSLGDNNDDYEVTIDAVANSPPADTVSQPRLLTIDYSKQTKRIHVLFPSLFVWFLSASVSIPLFVLSSILPNEQTPLVCGIVNFDPDNNQLVQYLFVAVRIVIPTVCLLFTLTSILWKMCRSGQLVGKCVLDENVVELLHLAAVLTMSFVIFSAQRLVGSSFYEVWTNTPFMLPKYPMLDVGLAIVLVMFYWSASALRPLAYLLADLDVRDEFRVTLGCGRRRKRRTKATGFTEIEL